MHPVICALGPITVHAYGLMLALAVLAAGFLFAREAELRLAVARELSQDLVFWSVVGGILGARLFYVLLNPAVFLDAPLEVFMLQHGGLAWQGGLLGGLTTAVTVVRWKKLPLLPLLDVAAPYIALGHAIGRIGCLLNGCCYGRPASWGLYFPVWGERLVPTQAFMTLGQVVIFLVLRQVARRHQAGTGKLFLLYLMLASLERFVIEFFRADHELFAGLSVFQYVSLAVALAAAFCWARIRAKA